MSMLRLAGSLMLLTLLAVTISCTPSPVPPAAPDPAVDAVSTSHEPSAEHGGDPHRHAGTEAQRHDHGHADDHGHAHEHRRGNGNDHGQANVAHTSLALFERRILPIFQSAKPSSCSECHLSGVDLKQYIRPTQQETFASLVAAGMIDMDEPDDSKILQFISRRPEEPSLVTEPIRRQEFQAFRSWIHAAVKDPDLPAEQASGGTVGPQIPEEVIRHARSDRVLASFIENVWTEMGRCAACHSPDRNRKQAKEYGDDVSWIKLGDPRGTLDYLLEAGLFDIAEPEASLMVTKPTMQEEHGGGQKMVIGDRTYQQFRRFIDDYAAVVSGEYQSTDQLPEPDAELSQVTDIWLRIEGVPAEYDKMLLQVDLHRWTDSGWSPYRLATSDRPVFGAKNVWAHSLSLTAPRDSQWADALADERLPPGRYLVKIYIDRTDKLQADFTRRLDEDDFVGQVEVESKWPAGHGRVTVIRYPDESSRNTNP